MRRRPQRRSLPLLQSCGNLARELWLQVLVLTAGWRRLPGSTSTASRACYP